MRYRFIQAEKAQYPVEVLCRMMAVARSGFYAWGNGRLIVGHSRISIFSPRSSSVIGSQKAAMEAPDSARPVRAGLADQSAPCGPVDAVARHARRVSATRSASAAHGLSCHRGCQRVAT
jgi:hypothetical protein